MKKLSNLSRVELKKGVAYKKKCVYYLISYIRPLPYETWSLDTKQNVKNSNNRVSGSMKILSQYWDNNSVDMRPKLNAHNKSEVQAIKRAVQFRLCVHWEFPKLHHTRGVFRTLSSICDEDCCKQSEQLKAVNYFQLSVRWLTEL